MATVFSFRLGRFFLLPPGALLGRDPGCDLVLTGPRASARHAEIRAQPDGDGWEIRDLGSRNGTRLDGRSLMGLFVPLRVDSEIVFGEPEERWRVVDLLPPGPCLFDPRAGERVDPIDGRLGDLVYDIERDAWCLGGDEVEPGTRVGRFELHVPTNDRMLETVPARVDLKRASLRIVATSDLDVIDVHVDDGAVRVSFPSKAWAITLYVLGMERQAQPDDGWIEVERLARLCGMERRILDVNLKRARDQFARAGVVNGETVVEVRRGQRRVGVRDVVVEQDG